MANGESRLNTNSYISLGLGLAVISTFVAGFWTMGVWFGNKFDAVSKDANMKFEELSKTNVELTYEVKDLTKRIDAMESKKQSDPWTGTDMFKWAARFQHDNPQSKVPEPVHEKGGE